MFRLMPVHAHPLPERVMPTRRACEIRRSATTPVTTPIICDKTGMMGTAPNTIDVIANRLPGLGRAGAMSADVGPIARLNAIGRANGTPATKRGGSDDFAVEASSVFGIRVSGVVRGPMSG